LDFLKDVFLTAVFTYCEAVGTVTGTHCFINSTRRLGRIVKSGMANNYAASKATADLNRLRVGMLNLTDEPLIVLHPLSVSMVEI